jgi:hypothetical protein
MKTALRSHPAASTPVFQRIEYIFDRSSWVALTNPIYYRGYWPPRALIAARSGYSSRPPPTLNPGKFPALVWKSARRIAGAFSGRFPPEHCTNQFAAARNIELPYCQTQFACRRTTRSRRLAITPSSYVNPEFIQRHSLTRGVTSPRRFGNTRPAVVGRHRTPPMRPATAAASGPDRRADKPPRPCR